MTAAYSSPINPLLAATITSPIVESRRWVENAVFRDDMPLINVSQAAPVDPPPAPLRQAMAEAVLNEVDSHLYGPVLGMPALRDEVAHQWSAVYGGAIKRDNVGITSGCNQAFCAAISSLAAPGDAVILPAPWYFNHKMWLDMAGIECRVLTCGDDMLPDPEQAAGMIDDRVKAIVLVTPNNPSGVEYPPALTSAFYKLAQKRGIALIVDETYRDFHSQTGAPHGLFADPDWQDTLIQLYSFSKAYRLTGHRVGAMICSASRMLQIEKFLDTQTICPNQLGQRGALFGMRTLGSWLARERQEILDRAAAMRAGFPQLDGWQLKGCGAYFAYVSHPFDAPSNVIAKALVDKAAVLALPGTMFSPTVAEGGTGHAERHFRIAFANVDRTGIATLFDRLAAFSP
ncbi:aminotransferase [Roseobacter sp. N2S]|uniref:aminotransferase n=1 Tax=Roseobacter sp. N2S TaxID=2663844 RepID=UPI0028582686|nr:aminotransferase [Roseobacter sp. N2S]MDR6265485.1 aspartate/methionine/tyrosine aminotransferase [Roseobacter sp. N2S]